MNKATIAIDIDDVVADFTEGIRLRVNEKFAIDIPKEAYQVKGNYWGYYEEVWGRHDALRLGVDFNHFLVELAEDQSNIPLLAGAQFAITRLMERYNVVFVTARDDSLEPATHRWFAQHFPEKDLHIHFTNHTNENKRVSKGEVCKQIGATYLIDDNIDHCLSALEYGITPLLFAEYGWQPDVLPEGIVRCKDWQVVLEYLDAA